RRDARGDGRTDAGIVNDASPDVAADAGPCPAGMVFVPLATGGSSVCVDRYEEATVKVAPDGTETPWPYDMPVDGLTVRAVVAAGIKPQRAINAPQAEAACKLL